MVAERKTDEIILDAALEVFIHKGLAGTRMQEIADLAGINKSLLHYYYRSKDQLFEAVFDRAIGSFLPYIKGILEAEMPVRQKILRFVESYIDVLLSNPHIPAFVIHELNTNPDRLVNRLMNVGIRPVIIINQFIKAAENGEIRMISGEHLIVNLLGMVLFPFIARPVVQNVLGKDEKEYKEFLKTRKSEIIDFVMHSIEP